MCLRNLTTEVNTTQQETSPTLDELRTRYDPTAARVFTPYGIGLLVAYSPERCTAVCELDYENVVEIPGCDVYLME